jgi:hypothetical protein
MVKHHRGSITGFARSIVDVRARAGFRLRHGGSAGYWEHRYRGGGNSGAGSYGELAKFKAEFLNALVRKNGVRSVIEFGCGDGGQLGLAEYPRYVGLDVARSAVDICARRFSEDYTKSFIWYDPEHFVNNGALTAELALSLDVILHLVEQSVLDAYIYELFNSATRLVAVFTEDTAEVSSAPHVVYRTVESWLPSVPPGWRLQGRYSNPLRGLSGCLADFFVFEREEAVSEGIHGK